MTDYNIIIIIKISRAMVIVLLSHINTSERPNETASIYILTIPRRIITYLRNIITRTRFVSWNDVARYYYNQILISSPVPELRYTRFTRIITEIDDESILYDADAISAHNVIIVYKNIVIILLSYIVRRMVETAITLVLYYR